MFDSLMTSLPTYGLPALFALSFFAATILPVGSEWLLATLVLRGEDFPTTIAVATLGNTLGAWTTYLLGLWGGEIMAGRLLRLDARNLVRARAVYRRWGAWSLLLAWLPVIGEPLCLLAGLMRLRSRLFLPLVAGGKCGRYLLVGLGALSLATP